MATIGGATTFTQQVLAVWTDGKTSHAVRPTGPQGPGGKGGPGEPRQNQLLPFQYQIPINKYSTLHNIAVKRSASAVALASQQLNNEDQKSRVFTTGTRLEPDEMANVRSGNSRNRCQVEGRNDSASWKKIEMVEQIGRQLDLLNNEDSEAAAAVIKVLRDQMDGIEKESQQRHHHHQHHQHHPQQTTTQQQKSNHHSTDTKTEDKGVQADWMLLLETEAELMVNRPQRLSVPDLTRPRQRIGSKSHSVDDDDAAPAADDDGARQASSAASSAAELEEELRLVNDRLVSARLREANLLAHLKDYRQRAEDLRRMISLRDSHIKRLEDEIARLKDALVEGRGKEKELQSFISDLQMTLDDLHSKYEEYVVLGQLRDSEHAQVVEALEQQVARLKEEKKALTYGQPALGYQTFGHLTKNAVHFQSTGCLVPAANTLSQNPDKATRGHRSVESSPSMRRCVRYKEAALAHDRNDPWDPDDDLPEPSSSGVHRSSPKQPGNYSASQSPIHARRGILHDRTGDSARTTPSSFNGRCTVDEADEDDESDVGATCRQVNDSDFRRGAVGPGARANIPLEGEPEVPRSRSLVRKASYICGIQQHSVLDDLTDSVD